MAAGAAGAAGAGAGGAAGAGAGAGIAGATGAAGAAGAGGAGAEGAAGGGGGAGCMFFYLLVYFPQSRICCSNCLNSSLEYDLCCEYNSSIRRGSLTID